jgi:hypothetical protein
MTMSMVPDYTSGEHDGKIMPMLIFASTLIICTTNQMKGTSLLKLICTYRIQYFVCIIILT